MVGSPHSRQRDLTSKLLDVSRSHKRWLACAPALIVVIPFFVYVLRGSTTQHPRILQEWHIQQPEGVPYSGANSRFVASGTQDSTLGSAAAEPVDTIAYAAATETAAAVNAVSKLAGSRTAESSPSWMTTDAEMLPLPPFQPTCIANRLERMDTWGCPVMMCNKDSSCTVHDPSCCAYLNYQMLSFLHDFLAAKCLHKEYLVMYGTGLGAVRNQTVIPWTEDLDLGITPLAIQFLELNETRQELWKHGYALWHHQGEAILTSCYQA